MTGLIQSVYDRTVRPVAIRAFGRRLSVVNGVAMRRQAITDFTRVVDLKSPMYGFIHEAVSPGDNVVDFAAGRGGFAVKAATEGATVDTYEAANRMFDWAEETVRLNDVAHRVTVHHAILWGDDSQVYGNCRGADAITVADLPISDGLILDCEGLEHVIVDQLTPETAPDYAVIETHPTHGSSTDAVCRKLDALGLSDITTADMVTDDKHAVLARRGG